jgi:hypothetical protein
MCLIINLVALTLFSIILNINGSDALNTWIKNFKNSSLKNNIRNYCNYNNDCQLYEDYNQVCVDHLCECQPNYKWNTTYRKCVYYSCFQSIDCKNYDANRICLNNKCVCSYPYFEDYMSKKCILKSQTTLSPIEKYCYDISYCGLNQFCVNKRCECQPNYAYNNLMNSCEYKNCKYDNDCNQFDNRQRCNSYGYCECKTYYAKDPITKFCNVTVGMFCSFNSDCTKYGDNNQVCVDNTCQCIPDYQLDSNNGFCSFQSCYNDYDCQKYDNHRVCEYNRCQCDYGYKEDYLSKKCNYFYSYNFWWLWMLFTIPAVIIIVALVRVCKLRNSRLHQSNHSINSSSPIFQSNQFIASHSQNVTINDPPPPYSGK